MRAVHDYVARICEHCSSPSYITTGEVTTTAVELLFGPSGKEWLQQVAADLWDMNHKALQRAKNETSNITEANGPPDCHSPDVTPMTKEFREYANRVHEQSSALSSIP